MVNVSTKSINVYSSKKQDTSAEPAKTEIETVTELCGHDKEDMNGIYWGVSGVKVGEIKPGDLFVRFFCKKENATSDPNQLVTDGDTVHKVLFRTLDGIVRYGYIQEYITAGNYNKKDSERAGRENFYLYNFDPENNILVKNNVTTPNDSLYIVKRELEYINSFGNKIGTLPVGTQLKGAGNAGASHNGYMYFKKMRENSNVDWKDLDDENSTGAFVNLDMKNGVNGYDRALW